MEFDAKQKFHAAKMTLEEFNHLVRGEWKPVELRGNSIPHFLRNIPEKKVLAIYGSGSFAEKNPVADGNSDRGQIGGIDVYRVAEEKDGVAINKDWYAIYQDPQTPEIIFVVGPQQDREHWINDTPDRLKLLFVDPDSINESIG